MALTPFSAVTALVRWSRQSQDVSRRNAMLAGTALLARRREHVEIQEFIAGALADRHVG